MCRFHSPPTRSESRAGVQCTPQMCAVKAGLTDREYSRPHDSSQDVSFAYLRHHRCLSHCTAGMLLRNLFEYFSILSYLRVSKANRSLKSLSKRCLQPCLGITKGKHQMRTQWRDACRQSTRSKCKNTPSKTKLVLLSQVRHKTKKCAELKHGAAKQRRKTVLEE